MSHDESGTRPVLGEREAIGQRVGTRTTEKRWLKSTVVSWISILPLGLLVVVALISSLSPPRRLQSFGDAGFSVGTDPDPARLGLNRLHVR
ncbi:MAG: hypothetical protein ACREIN_04020, partial [Candidatus Methylomirabilaceae bacterium]